MRVENNGIRYFSFAEIAQASGIKPVSKTTNDKEKLNNQRKTFKSKHRCKACGEPMTWIEGANIMTCLNEKCKGIKHVRKDKEGNDVVFYTTSYDLLDDLGTEIATNIF